MIELWNTKTNTSEKEHTPEEFYDRAGIWAFGKLFLLGIFCQQRRYPKLQGYLFF
jgi:hypothetical protein